MIQDITIPDIGENITEGNVVGVLVKKGDKVENEQTIIEFETDKAVVEIPAPGPGKITEVSVSEGDTVKVGPVIATLETGDSDTDDTDDDKDSTEDKKKSKEDSDDHDDQDKKKAESKDSDDDKADSDKQEEDKDREQESDKKKADQADDEEKSKKKAGKAKEEDKGKDEDEDEDEGKVEDKDKDDDESKDAADDADDDDDDDGDDRESSEKRPAAKADMEADTVSTPGWSVPWIRDDVAPAAPSVRRLARELGADIREVRGSGPEGRISMDDVKAHVKQAMQQGPGGSGAPVAGQPKLPDFSKWGEIKRESMNKVREITARSMATAWTTVPHVTQFDKADITQLEEFRKKYAKKVEKAGGKLTVTAILLKVLAQALEKFPRFNATIDIEKNEIIFKNYIHIAMAVDTDRGLLVPVLRDVNKKSITELAREVVDLADRTRKKKIKPEELEGGSFTVSNQGSIGGTDFTPIVYWPQVAILGVSRSSVEPKWIDGEVQPRMILPLSLSYDHRILDGADAARFLRWLCEGLENPLSMYFD